MKNLIKLLAIAFLFISVGVEAQDSTQVRNMKGKRFLKQERVQNQTAVKEKTGFIDEDGDGYNDNAADADGDGIPNGQDPDYTGQQARKGSKAKGFVDADGDGLNDNAADADGDGIPNGQDPDYMGSKARKGGKSRGFVDADGDGINDNALDADGDGVPNGQDPDYTGSENCQPSRGQRLGGSDTGSPQTVESGGSRGDGNGGSTGGRGGKGSSN